MPKFFIVDKKFRFILSFQSIDSFEYIVSQYNAKRFDEINMHFFCIFFTVICLFQENN